MRRWRLPVEVPTRRRGGRTSLPPFPRGRSPRARDQRRVAAASAVPVTAAHCRLAPAADFGTGRPARGWPSPGCRHRCLPTLQAWWRDGSPESCPGAGEPPVLPQCQRRLPAQTRGRDAQPLGCGLSRLWSANDDPSRLLLDTGCSFVRRKIWKW